MNINEEFNAFIRNDPYFGADDGVILRSLGILPSDVQPVARPKFISESDWATYYAPYFAGLDYDGPRPDCNCGNCEFDRSRPKGGLV